MSKPRTKRKLDADGTISSPTASKSSRRSISKQAHGHGHGQDEALTAEQALQQEVVIDRTPRRVTKSNLIPSDDSPFKTSPLPARHASSRLQQVDTAADFVLDSPTTALSTRIENVEKEAAVFPEESEMDPVFLEYMRTPGYLVVERYKPLKFLGKGQYSFTYLAEDHYHDPPKPVAIKRMMDRELNPSAAAEFKHYHYLQRHDPEPKNIVTVYDQLIAEDGVMNLVFEPLDSGRTVEIPACSCETLHDGLQCPEREYKFAKLAKQLLMGLYELHFHGYIHGDVKPENILYVPNSNRIKLIDLGSATEPEKRDEVAEDYNYQSIQYRAPEILLGAGPVTEALDIWSAGIVLAEWFLGDIGKDAFLKYRCRQALASQRIAIMKQKPSDPIMTAQVPNHQSVVQKMIDLFGSAQCYRAGRYWDFMYEEFSSVRIGQKSTPKTGEFLAFLQEACSPGFVEFMKRMLVMDVSKRASAEELLRDTWLVERLYGRHAWILLQNLEPKQEVQASDSDEEKPLATPREIRAIRDNTVQTLCSSKFIDAEQEGEEEAVTPKPAQQPKADAARQKSTQGRTSREVVQETPKRSSARQAKVPSSGASTRTEEEVDEFALRLL